MDNGSVLFLIFSVLDDSSLMASRLISFLWLTRPFHTYRCFWFSLLYPPHPQRVDALHEAAHT